MGSGSFRFICAVSPEPSSFMYEGSHCALFLLIPAFVIQLKISCLSSTSISPSLRAIFSKTKLAAVFTACAANATISSRVTYLVCALCFVCFLVRYRPMVLFYFVVLRGLVLYSYYFLLTVFVVFFEQTVSLFSLLVKHHRIFRKKGLVISCLFEIVTPLLAL